jgi:hypothetical protein
MYNITNNNYLEIKQPNTKRKLLSCQARQRGIDGKLRQCSKIYRKDRCPKTCKHVFALEVTEIPAVIIPRLEEPTELVKQIALTSAEINLSLNQVSSISFQKMIDSAIQFGFHFKESNKAAGISDIPPTKTSRSIIRNAIIEQANHKKTENLKKLQSTNYLCVAIDNGTIVHRHLLFIALMNQSAGVLPTFYSADTTGNWTRDEFALFGIRFINELQSKNIIITSFVGDNLPAQIGGLGHWNNMAFQNLNLEEITSIHKSVLYSPCSNHVLNLALKDLLQVNSLFDSTIDRLHRIIQVFHKSEMIKLLKSRIPDIPTTRWIYSYDALYWIMKNRRSFNFLCTESMHRPKLIEIFRDEDILEDCVDGIPQDFVDLSIILKPIKILSQILESNNTSLSDVAPLLNATFIKLDSVKEELEIPNFAAIISDLKICILHRFKTTHQWNLIISSFCFTVRGRHFLRKLGALDNPPSTIELSDDNEDEINIFDDKNIENDVCVTEPNSDEEEIDVSEENENILLPNIRDSVDETDFDQSAPEEAELTLDPLVFSETHDEYNICHEMIQYLSECLGFPQKEIDDCHQHFDNWIFQATAKVQFGYNMTQSIDRFWKVTNSFDKTSKLPQIALRLLSIGASEASCERLVSENRSILNVHSQRQKDDLIHARNVLRASALIEQKN